MRAPAAQAHRAAAGSVSLCARPFGPARYLIRQENVEQCYKFIPDRRQLARYPDDLAGGLKAYEAERRLRTHRVTLQAREQFCNNRKVPAPAPLSRDWIFAHDVTIGAAAVGAVRRADWAVVASSPLSGQS